MFKKGILLAVKTAIIAFSATFFLGLGFLFSVIFIGGFIGGLADNENDESVDSLAEYHHLYGKEDSDAKFVSIPINGVVMGEQQPGDELFTSFMPEGIVYGYDVKKQLVELADEKNVKGIILEIHSPGGTIFGSQAIVDGINIYQEKTNKPVIAYVGSMAASGGYWIAAAADTIVADHGTSLGSIGVILGPFKYYDGVVSENGGLLAGGVETQNGISTEYITAGTSKDLGNPYRQLTDQERTILQDSVNNSYNLFVNLVAHERELTPEQVRTLGALIYDDVQALNNKLIDQIGNKDEAYDQLARAANVSEFEILRRDSSSSFWDYLQEAKILAKSRSTSSQSCLFGSHTQALAFYGDAGSLCH